MICHEGFWAKDHTHSCPAALPAELRDSEAVEIRWLEELAHEHATSSSRILSLHTTFSTALDKREQELEAAMCKREQELEAAMHTREQELHAVFKNYLNN